MLEKIRKTLEAQVRAREKALALQRQIIPLCGQAIRDAQKNKMTTAQRKARTIQLKIEKAETILKNTPELVEPVLGSAYQEYAELAVLLNYLKTEKLGSVDVPPKYYLLGLLDAVGELKRVGMQLLADQRLEEAEALYDNLEGIYAETSKTMYPNAIVPGLKPRLDGLRRTLNSFHDLILSYRVARP